ncbi:MAG: DUF373 family protein [Candidatus Methanospirare jalkutatii]|nr:MAG: DUF373 family protein [Candidatus Methanospirare jalkutatii]UYZ40247.1 MAG: DUF373 family protein [Candidatus Methanospirare jalkutatii]
MSDKILVLCVDRDNDVGEKAGVETPVVGKTAVEDTAKKFALADPEDSDVNALFAALKIYEDLKEDLKERTAQQEESEEGAEIALIAGDRDIGVKSDTKIASQLDEVLARTGAKRAIIVTDGSEDEEILPIVQSRMRIDAVRRVIVRQSEPLESGFYMLKRLFEEEKFSRSFLTPLGLAMLAISISLILGQPSLSIGLILGILGIYALLKGIGLGGVLADFIAAMRSSLYTGKISFVTDICALVLALAGAFQGTLSALSLLPANTEGFSGSILVATAFVKASIWWFICAAVAIVVGKMMNMVIEGERIVRQWAILFSIVASGLILYGGSECIMAISGINGANAWEGYQILFFSILGAVFLSFIGVRISWYARISAEKRGELGEQVGQSREGESEGVTRVQEAEAMVAAEEAEN